MSLFAKVSAIGTLCLQLLACSDSAQQADADFKPLNMVKQFSIQNSPVVFVDAAHNNFLTLSGRYAPFGQVLKSAGYTVNASNSRFTLAHLNRADILVIANALDKKRSNWAPPYTAAFTANEVVNLKQWVLEGGSLFLVADHAPFPAVISKLAEEFGIEFSNGHVSDAVFRVKNQTLREHDITCPTVEQKQTVYASRLLIDGLGVNESAKCITQVRTFGGSAFQVPDHAISLLTLHPNAVSLVPKIPFQVNADTPKLAIGGWSQGAVMEVGKGRVAIFSEGMMFSSQRDLKTNKVYGLRSQGAEQNERFLLNVMSWLSHVL